MPSHGYLRKLTAEELETMREILRDEVITAARRHAEPEHVDGVVELLDVVELRIAVDTEGLEPTVQHRQRIAGERRPTVGNGR